MNAAKAMRIGGWVLTGLLALFLIGVSGVPKFSPPAEALPYFEKFGTSKELMFNIGIVEVVCTILFVLPWTGFLGAILLTAYFGGAVFTHARVGDPWFFPIIFGVLTWVALGLRRPEIFALAMGKRASAHAGSGT